MTMLVGWPLYCELECDRAGLTRAVTLLSIFASDAIALPLSPAFPTGELQYIVDNSGAKVFLATEKQAEKASQVLSNGLSGEPLFDIRPKLQAGAAGSESIKLEDLKQAPSGGMMLYTSGTTNRPVCVLLQVYDSAMADPVNRKACYSPILLSLHRLCRSWKPGSIRHKTGCSICCPCTISMGLSMQLSRRSLLAP